MGIKKLIAIFLLIAVLFMPFSVFADVPMPDPPLGSLQYWVVARSYGEIYLLTSNSPITVEYSDISGLLYFQLSSCKSYTFINDQWSYDREWLGGVEFRVDEIFASNHNIAYNDGSGFFFSPPKASTLYQIVRQAKNQGIFGKMWKIISAGLIPLVGLLILGISFRKGWAFLRNQLMH